MFSFPDGTKITVKDPTMHMTNLLSSNKVLKVSGTMTLTDETNNLEAVFTYGAAATPKPQGTPSRMQRFKTMMSNKIFGSKNQQEASQ